MGLALEMQILGPKLSLDARRNAGHATLTMTELQNVTDMADISL